MSFSDFDNNQSGAKIKVFGTGGAGCNAINGMIRSGLNSVEFWVANTDTQALKNSQTANQIQLGSKLTRGLVQVVILKLAVALLKRAKKKLKMHYLMLI